MDPADHTDHTESAWDPRRGAKFEPPSGWSIVDGLPEGEDISHLDGLTYFWYGNWLLPDNPEGWRILTTPNSTWIPYPYPLHRDVYLRQDGFLGHEDPVLWPQLYNEALPYLACVSLGGSTDPDALFFRKRVDAEFIDPAASFPRRCELSMTAKSRCREVWTRLKHRYTKFVRQHGSDRHKRLNVVTSQFEVGLGSVSRFRGTYLELTFRFSTLCRLYLEIEAYYRHHELSGAHEFSMDTRPVDTSLVGTITTDETVCYRFHRMGVPVWLARRLDTNSGTPCRLITDKTPLNPDTQRTTPGGINIVVSRVPSIRPIFEGASDDASYLVHIADWVRDSLRTELGEDHPLHSFFASYQRKPRLLPGNGAGSSNKRKAGSSGGGEPSQKSKRGKSGTANEPSATTTEQQADLKQLLEYVTPKASGAWETVDRELESELKPSLRLVPALDVFTGVDNVLQLKRFVYAWLKVKDRWLLRVSGELQPPEFANRRAWRTFMRGSFDLAPIKPESEAGKSRLRFTDYLGLPAPPRFDINSTRFGLNPSHPLDRTVEKTMIRNALHEINDISFLHDVYEVELRRTWDLPSVIVERLQHVAGDNKNFFANPAPLPRSPVSQRLKWVLALKEIVKEWPTSLPKPRDFDLVPRTTTKGPKVEDVLLLELAVARCYCRVAEEILGRRPTIPLYR